MCADIWAVVVVMTVRIVLLSMLPEVFTGIIDNVCNDGGNIVVVGVGGGVICESADVIIPFQLIMCNNVKVRIELILIKAFFGDGGDGILI